MAREGLLIRAAEGLGLHHHRHTLRHKCHRQSHRRRLDVPSDHYALGVTLRMDIYWQEAQARRRGRRVSNGWIMPEERIPSFIDAVKKHEDERSQYWDLNHYTDKMRAIATYGTVPRNGRDAATHSATEADLRARIDTSNNSTERMKLRQ